MFLQRSSWVASELLVCGCTELSFVVAVMSSGEGSLQTLLKSVDTSKIETLLPHETTVMLASRGFSHLLLILNNFQHLGLHTKLDILCNEVTIEAVSTDMELMVAYLNHAERLVALLNSFQVGNFIALGFD